MVRSDDDNDDTYSLKLNETIRNFSCRQNDYYCTESRAGVDHAPGDQQEQELREAFDTIDLDKGGTIDMEELMAAFEKCLLLLHPRQVIFF